MPSLKHKFQSTVSDAPANGAVRPSNWNDEHSLQLSSGYVLGRVTASYGDAEELSPTSVRALINVADGATANSTDAFLLDRANHTGTESADVLTDGTTNKAFLATERTKLAGIATGATANSTDALLLARANHTGTQLAATISDFSTAATLVLNTTAKAVPVDADRVYQGNSASSFAAVYSTWTQIKAFMKTYWDTLYQPLAAALTSWAAVVRAAGFDTFVATPTSANLLALLTTKTGTGNAVFANTPALVTPDVGAATGTSLVTSGLVTVGGLLSVSASGLKFPASDTPQADANTIDDFEKGTFTPTMVGGTLAGAGTYSRQVGRYVKISSLVAVTGDLVWSAHTGTGQMFIGALPFTANAAYPSGKLLLQYDNLTFTGIPSAEIGLGSAGAGIYVQATAAARAALAMDTAASLGFSGIYST